MTMTRPSLPLPQESIDPRQQLCATETGFIPPRQHRTYHCPPNVARFVIVQSIVPRKTQTICEAEMFGSGNYPKKKYIRNVKYKCPIYIFGAKGLYIIK